MQRTGVEPYLEGSDELSVSQRVVESITNVLNVVGQSRLSPLIVRHSVPGGTTRRYNT